MIALGGDYSPPQIGVTIGRVLGQWERMSDKGESRNDYNGLLNNSAKMVIAPLTID